MLKNKIKILAILSLITIGFIITSPILIIFAVFMLIAFSVWMLTGDVDVTITKTKE